MQSKVNATRWIARFRENQNRPFAPDWESAMPLANPHQTRELARSLAIFQLGESGGGTRVTRQARAAIAKGDLEPAYADALALFLAEEHGHAALLEDVVLHLGGELQTGNWTNRLFRWLRPRLDLTFDLQVLLTAEIIAMAYYGSLYRSVACPCLRGCFQKILRDEVGHIAFHGDYFRARFRSWLPATTALWSAGFQLLLVATRNAVWLDHRVALEALGVRRAEFMAETARAYRNFLKQCDRSPGSGPGRARPVISGCAQEKQGHPHHYFYEDYRSFRLRHLVSDRPPQPGPSHTLHGGDPLRTRRQYFRRRGAHRLLRREDRPLA